jgi:hypothetical protein
MNEARSFFLRRGRNRVHKKSIASACKASLLEKRDLLD